MSITYRIDKFSGIIYAVAEKTISIEEILNTLKSVAADPDFKPAFQLLSDHRKLEKPITTEQLKMWVEYVKTHREFFQFSKWAMVVSTPVSYGMMRMLSMLLESVLVEVQVFKHITEAELWLAGNILETCEI